MYKFYFYIRLLQNNELVSASGTVDAGSYQRAAALVDQYHQAMGDVVSMYLQPIEMAGFEILDYPPVNTLHITANL